GNLAARDAAIRSPTASIAAHAAPRTPLLSARPANDSRAHNFGVDRPVRRRDQPPRNNQRSFHEGLGRGYRLSHVRWVRRVGDCIMRKTEKSMSDAPWFGQLR